MLMPVITRTILAILVPIETSVQGAGQSLLNTMMFFFGPIDLPRSNGTICIESLT